MVLSFAADATKLGRGGEIRTPGVLLPKRKHGGIGVYRSVPIGGRM
jgi:hypothetical protein